MQKTRAFCQFFQNAVLAVRVNSCKQNWTDTIVFTILKRKVLMHQLFCGPRGRQSQSEKNPQPNKAEERRQNVTEKQTNNTTSLLSCVPFKGA